LRDVSAENGVDWLDNSRAALFIDLDNDGDQDLVIGHTTALLLNENDGTGRFALRTQLPSISRLFSLNAVDYDDDVDPYVANDFGRNNLYRNDGGKFVDVAGASGVEDIGPGMSAAWGDANNDGRPALYVSNMFSSAGRPNANANANASESESELAGFKRHARGNSLFQNTGDGTFADQAVESGTVMGRWAWGSLFADFNNDGWQDLYVTNGFVTADEKDDL
jgi:hypothetical protein